jgi:hypothetical protein
LEKVYLNVIHVSILGGLGCLGHKRMPLFIVVARGQGQKVGVKTRGFKQSTVVKQHFCHVCVGKKNLLFDLKRMKPSTASGEKILYKRPISAGRVWGRMLSKHKNSHIAYSKTM